MKYPLFFLLFVSLVGIGSPSYGEWKYLIKSSSGDVHYIDYDSLEREGDYVYFWSLRDYGKMDQWGDLSSKKYLKVDCTKYKFKYLTDSYHNRQMGQGIPTGGSRKPDKNWTNVTPNSVIALIFQNVCI
tara:strand:- start:413 stop:799 length:387 start_codon:yes stop_codon:yes gene_type:complete